MAENKRILPGFIGESYRDDNPRYDCQQTINYYLQQDESLNGKEKQVTELLQRPGLTLLQTLLPGPIRLLQELTNNAGAIAVSGNQVYYLPGGNASPVNIVGTMGTSSGYVSLADNGGYVIIVDGTTTYYTFEIGSEVLVAETSVSYPGASQVTYQDGFFFFVQPLTPNTFVSANTAPEGGSGGGPIAWPSPGLGSNIAVKQGYADIMVGAISNSREVCLFGTQSGEWWFDEGVNSASAVNPFSREDGKNFMVGCVSQATIYQLAGTIFWVGENPQGGAVVYFMNGYTPQRISTHAVEFSLSSVGDLSGASAFGMLYNGHYMYVIQIPGLNTTWVYDLSAITDVNPATGAWVEFQTQQSNNSPGPWIAGTHCFLNGVHLVGDSTNGNIYQLDPKNATDNGMTIMRRRRSPHISKNLNRHFYGLLQADFLMGQGLVNNQVNTSNNVNPRAVLRTSDDGGQTYDLPMYQDLGAIGQYKARARWARLGQAYDRVFEITITDNVIAHLIVVTCDWEEVQG